MGYTYILYVLLMSNIIYLIFFVLNANYAILRFIDFIGILELVVQRRVKNLLVDLGNYLLLFVHTVRYNTTLVILVYLTVDNALSWIFKSKCCHCHN